MGKGDAKKDFPYAEGYADFRKLLERQDIDAVICAPVDHWHTVVSMGAMMAGKDVYCEKPLTLAIDEGRRLVDVQRETGRVLQTGTQQRSRRKFRLACDLARNGRIGKIERAEVWLPAGLREGPFATAAATDFVPSREHVARPRWRWRPSSATFGS